jgi:hypothetical protein
MGEFSLEVLEEKRLELIDEYYYWMYHDATEEELEDIQNSIEMLERHIAILRGEF